MAGTPLEAAGKEGQGLILLSRKRACSHVFHPRRRSEEPERCSGQWSGARGTFIPDPSSYRRLNGEFLINFELPLQTDFYPHKSQPKPEYKQIALCAWLLPLTATLWQFRISSRTLVLFLVELSDANPKTSFFIAAYTCRAQ